MRAARMHQTTYEGDKETTQAQIQQFRPEKALLDTDNSFLY